MANHQDKTLISIFTGTGLSLLALLILAVTLALPAPVSAKQARVLTGSFGAATSSTPDPYPLSKVPGFAQSGIGVDDSTHDVYVSDQGNHRVEKFDSAGNFLLAFGANVGGPGVNVCGGLVLCMAGTSGSAPGDLTTPTFLAVDDSPGPSKGDIYVADENRISKFDSSGELISGWGNGGQIDGSEITSPPAKFAGPFKLIGGIAVDTIGNLWVGNHKEIEERAKEENRNLSGTVFEFGQNAIFITDWHWQEGVYSGMAIDGKGDLYLGTTKVKSSGEEVGVTYTERIKEEEERIVQSHLAVDVLTNEIYVAQTNENLVQGWENFKLVRYASCYPGSAFESKEACNPSESFGVGQISSSPAALAVDAVSEAKTVYVVEESGQVLAFGVESLPAVSTEKASSVTSTSAVLNGLVDPEGVLLLEGGEGCRFEWGETEAYGHVVSCEESAAQIGKGSVPVEVHAKLTGLQPGGTVHFRFVAANEHGVEKGGDLVFGPPVLESESVLSVSSTSATFQVQADMKNVAGSFHFDYGRDAGYGQSTVEGGLAEGGSGQVGSVHVQNLQPSTVYHFRVVVVNQLGVVEGVDRSFMTQGAGSTLVLPDGRQWEQVSPVDKHGARLLPILVQGLLQAAASGGAISYPASLPTEGGAQGYFEVEQLFSRRGATGWGSEDVSLPHSGPVGTVLGAGSEFRLFSEELSSVVIEPFGHFTSLAPCVSPLDSERTPYIRSNNTPCGGRMGTYEPLLTSEDVLPGAEFGGSTTHNPYTGEAHVVDASGDLSHVLLDSSVGLTPPPKAGENGKGVFHEGHSELYEWSAGKPAGETLQPVSVLPNDTFASSSVLGYKSNNARGAVSSDGTRVVWSGESKLVLHLYDRDMVAGSTIMVDTPQAACVASKECGDGLVGPVFQFASRDGSLVFFTDTQRLTANAGVAGKADLYVCEILEGACVLSDLSATGAGSGSGADVQGLLPGASEDGSSVYFVANGVLAAGASQGTCDRAESPSGATCNLYVERRGGAGWEAPRLVGVLGGEDWPDWKGALGAGAGLGELMARVSGDGRFLAFMSDRSLTGYDNRDAVTGLPDEEVFLYDAQGSGGAGRLVCASCNPTGARPVGVEYKKLQNGLTGSEASGFRASQGIAASVPGWTSFKNGEARYQSRYLSAQGRLFFASSDALVPQDINNNEDVYEFEPAGIGDCTTASSTFSEASGGCASLISSGTADGESGFLDASATGGDVFFLTGERLVSSDVDTAVDLYDARACSAGSPCVSYPAAPPACTTADGCRAAPTPQPAIFGSPSSATFTGAGNTPPGGTGTVIKKTRPLSAKQKLARALRACHKEKRKRRALCERQAHKRYAAKQARTGNANGKGRR
jgi:hypothetical protein